MGDQTIYGRPTIPFRWRILRFGLWVFPAAILGLLVVVAWYLLQKDVTWATTWAVSTTVLLAGWAWMRDVWQGRAQRIHVALRYIERFNDPEMVAVKVAAAKFWRSHLYDRDALDRVLDYIRGGKGADVDDDFVHGLYSVYAYLNFLEELAMAYRRSYIETVVVRQYFQDVLMQADSSYRGFLEGYNTVRPHSYPHLEALIIELKMEDANRA